MKNTKSLFRVKAGLITGFDGSAIALTLLPALRKANCDFSYLLLAYVFWTFLKDGKEKG